MISTRGLFHPSKGGKIFDAVAGVPHHPLPVIQHFRHGRDVGRNVGRVDIECKVQRRHLLIRIQFRQKDENLSFLPFGQRLQDFFVEIGDVPPPVATLL